MTTAEILRGARERLSSPRRWRKHDYGPDGAGRVCIVGACAVAAGETDIHTIEQGPVGALLSECVGSGLPISFNDDPETTHADVLRVLDCAIQKATEQAAA